MKSVKSGFAPCGAAGQPGRLTGWLALVHTKDLLSARLKHAVVAVRRIAAADGDDGVSAGATLPAEAASAAAADGDGVVAGVAATTM